MNIRAKRIMIIFDNGSNDSWETTCQSGIRFDDAMRMIARAWKEYDKPDEPLIEDEKIRKAVRAWADANGLLAFKVVNKHFNCFEIIGYGDHNVSSRIEFKSTIANANKNQYYTITELCGGPEPLEPTFIGLDERIKEKEEE